MMKSTVILVSLFVMSEPLICTGCDDLPTSVPFHYDGSDLREMVDVKTDSFALDTGITDVSGNDLESNSCLGELFTKRGQDLTVDLIDCVDDVQIIPPFPPRYYLDQDEIHAKVITSFRRHEDVRQPCGTIMRGSETSREVDYTTNDRQWTGVLPDSFDVPRHRDSQRPMFPKTRCQQG